MVKSLSDNFANFNKLEMAAWSRSSEQECVKRLSPYRVVNVDIGIYNKRSTAQIYGVGENPLNGKGVVALW